MNSHLEKAIAILNIRPDVAVRELKACLSEEPEIAYAHALLALCYVELKNSEAAFEEAREALRLNPEDGFSFYALARCHLNAVEYIEAEVAIDEALELDPFNSDYLWLLALIHVCNEEFEPAREVLDRSLEHDAHHASSLSLRAYVLNKLGKKDESDQANEEALSISPEDAWGHTFRGWALVERKDFKQALHHFREALRIDPSINWAREGLITTMPSQHWIYQLHLKLRNKIAGLLAFVWLAGNFVISCNVAKAGTPLEFVGVYLSWLGLAVFLLLVFLPDSTITGPVLKLIVQLEPDGRFILTEQERKLNLHLIGFSILFIVFTIMGFMQQLWLPLEISVFGFFVSRLLLLETFERDKKTCLIHVGAGAAVAGLLVLCTTYQVASIALFRGFAYLQLGKILASATGVKILAGAFGAGALATAAKQKKKDKAREKMMKGL
jgi:tetratricopeptide (TPR) repeat protein